MTAMQIPSLRDKAVLVRVSRSMYVPSLCDKQATEIAENALQAGRKSGRFIKKLLVGCKELKECQHAFQDVYTYYIDHTLPWMDEGVRILPNEQLLEFGAELGHLKNKAFEKVKELEDVWGRAVQADQIRLGNMFNLADYPTPEQMKDKWDVRIMFLPVPASDDFRVGMDDVDKERLDNAVRQAQQESTDYLCKQLLEPVQAMISKLQVPIGDEGSIFRDSLVSNLKDVSKRARNLNINHSEKIDKLCDEIESALENIDPNTLRTCAEARSATCSRMKDLQTKASQWF